MVNSLYYFLPLIGIPVLLDEKKGKLFFVSLRQMNSENFYYYMISHNFANFVKLNPISKILLHSCLRSIKTYSKSR